MLSAELPDEDGPIGWRVEVPEKIVPATIAAG
jgi:hypothetical protein